MTTVVSTSTIDVSPPTSYVSRWVAQTHAGFCKKPNEFYSLSSPSSSSSASCEYRTPPSTKTPTTTTWQAQARSRLSAALPKSDPSPPLTSTNDEFQEKMQWVRALLDAKKQRLVRQCSSSSSSTSEGNHHLHPHHNHSSTATRDPSSFSLPCSSTLFPVENVYYPHEDSPLSVHHQHSHHHHHHHSSLLPCLMEESPSDSGCSDGTKATHHEDILDSPMMKNPALIDLSKPLSKEEMLAIIQILRELWKKQFGCELPETNSIPKAHLSPRLAPAPAPPPPPPPTTFSSLLKKKSQYHSTPSLNKLSAELSDIKDKLKRFSTSRTTNEDPPPWQSIQRRQSIPEEVLIEAKVTPVALAVEEQETIQPGKLVFVPLGPPPTPELLKRMQMKKDLLIRRQIQRREEQLIKKNERLMAAAENQNEYRLYEDYLAQRRQEEERRRQTILQAHIDQKRREADPPSSHDYYFAAARTRHRLKRKASMNSFVSFDDEISFGGSTFDLFSTTSGKKPMAVSKRTSAAFDFLSPSLTASTAASRSKMNRAVSTCNINEHYDSFTSLNSKATMPMARPTRPAALFGGSLMNINLLNGKTSQTRSNQLLEDPFDLRDDSPLTGSLSSLAFSNLGGSHLARSQTHLSTKSNKQTMLNALRQVVLAGPSNEQQRQVVTREIELSDARHFIMLFRDHRMQFRAVYMYIPDTDMIEKLYGIGPNVITEVMVEKWFKYNSGSKRFTTIPIRHFSIQCDAVVIHNEFWQKKLLQHMNKLH